MSPSPAPVGKVVANAAPDSSTQLKLPFAFTGAIIVLTLVGKAGDVLAPSLVGPYPIILLCLNANDVHLALTATNVSLLPWILVGAARRLVEDPVFFLIGAHTHAAASSSR